MRSLTCVLTVAVVAVGCAKPVGAPPTPATPTSTTSAAESTAPAAEPGSEAPEEEFGLGKHAPKFEGLVGVDDKQHSLEDYADAKAIAIVFTCNHCPVAKAYEERLVALDKDYSGRGVQLVAINVNNIEQDKLPAMKERATEKGFEFPYLYDPTQKVGRDFGATVTPHVFLLDDKRMLAYVGPIDDNMDDPAAAKPLLRDAIDAVLAGKEPETKDVKPVGCGIQYE